MNQDTAAVAARVEAFQRSVAQAEKDVDRFGAMRQEITAVESVETSGDGSVRVVAGPAGAVRSVTIGEPAMVMSAQTLSRLVTTTIQQAVAKSAREQAEIVQRYAGDRTDIAARVNKVQEELANPPAPDSWEAPAHRRPIEDYDNAVSAGIMVDDDSAPRSQRPAAPSRPADDEVFHFGSEEY
jgi:DNA-binding protein YbaB